MDDPEHASAGIFSIMATMVALTTRIRTARDKSSSIVLVARVLRHHTPSQKTQLSELCSRKDARQPRLFVSLE
jgi:hypothetical protein